MNFAINSRRWIPALLASVSLLLVSGCASHRCENSSTCGGITDGEIRDVIARVARHQIHPLADGDYRAVKSIAEATNAAPPVGIAWNYPWGVTLRGMMRTTDFTQDAEVAQFVTRHNQICANYFAWLSATPPGLGEKEFSAFARSTKLKGLMTLGTLDNCGSMGSQFLENMKRQSEVASATATQIVTSIAGWIVSQQERLPDGTLWRENNMGGTLWPDDLYMGGVFLVRWGQFTGDPKHLSDAANQIIHQAALEQDADGLWFHGYFINEKKAAPYKWGRGNGWVMVSLVETLSALPENHPLRPQLLTILRRQIDGLKKYQAPIGLWRQVLDKPELWEETSCTAMFAYGIARAVNRGWIEKANLAIARRAFAGLAKNVTSDGAVRETCKGTNISLDLEYYLKRPRPDDDPHGPGPVMLAGAEILAATAK